MARTMETKTLSQDTSFSLSQIGRQPRLSGFGRLSDPNWYEDSAGYGAIITAPSGITESIASLIKQKKDVAILLHHRGYSSILYITPDLLINRLEVWKPAGSYIQRSIDGALRTYFNQHLTDYKYVGHQLPNNLLIDPNYIALPYDEIRERLTRYVKYRATGMSHIEAAKI